MQSSGVDGPAGVLFGTIVRWLGQGAEWRESIFKYAGGETAQPVSGARARPCRGILVGALGAKRLRL